MMQQDFELSFFSLFFDDFSWHSLFQVVWAIYSDIRN